MNTGSMVSSRAVQQPERLRWFLAGMDAAIKCLEASDASDMAGGNTFFSEKFDLNFAGQDFSSAETFPAEAVFPKCSWNLLSGGKLADWQHSQLCYASPRPDLLDQPAFSGQLAGIPSRADHMTYYFPQIQPQHFNEDDMGHSIWTIQPGFSNLAGSGAVEVHPPTEVATPSLQSFSGQRSEGQNSPSHVPEELSMEHYNIPSICSWIEGQYSLQDTAGAHGPMPSLNAAPSPSTVAKPTQQEILPGTELYRDITPGVSTPSSCSHASSPIPSQARDPLGPASHQVVSPPQPSPQPSAVSTRYPGSPSSTISEPTQLNAPLSPSNPVAVTSHQEPPPADSSYQPSPLGTKRSRSDSHGLCDVTYDGNEAERLDQSRLEAQTPVSIDLTQDPVDDTPRNKRRKMNQPVPTVQARRYKAQRRGRKAQMKGRKAQYKLVSLATRDQEAPFLWNTRLGQWQRDGEDGVCMKQILEPGTLQRIYLKESINGYSFMLEKTEEGWTGYDLDGRQIALKHSEISSIQRES